MKSKKSQEGNEMAPAYTLEQVLQAFGKFYFYLLPIYLLQNRMFFIVEFGSSWENEGKS